MLLCYMCSYYYSRVSGLGSEGPGLGLWYWIYLVVPYLSSIQGGLKVNLWECLGFRGNLWDFLQGL